MSRGSAGAGHSATPLKARQTGSNRGQGKNWGPWGYNPVLKGQAI